jgi:hypothetical protein
MEITIKLKEINIKKICKLERKRRKLNKKTNCLRQKMAIDIENMSELKRKKRKLDEETDSLRQKMAMDIEKMCKGKI